MTTLADVWEIAAENMQDVTTYVDNATPAGHFAATSDSLDDKCKTIYLLEGEKDSPNAQVKGWVFMVFDGGASMEAHAYVTDENKVEKPLGRVRRYSGPTESFASVFTQMV